MAVIHGRKESERKVVPAATGDEGLPFHLQMGEKILLELKPNFIGYMLISCAGEYATSIALAIIAFVSLIILKMWILAIIIPILIALLGIGISFIRPLITYGKLKYWITNHRAIGRRGFLEYSINSIPLENVTDVVITRSVMDRILGLSSLIILPMASTPTVQGSGPDKRAESSNFFHALPVDSAIHLQKMMFDLRDHRRSIKEEEPKPKQPPIGPINKKKHHPEILQSTPHIKKTKY